MFISRRVPVGTALMTYVGDPPAAPQLYGLARELGRAVARDMLPLEEAYAACINAALEAERTDGLSHYNASDVCSFLRFLVQDTAKREDERRMLARHRIRRTLQPLVAMHKPSHILRAEAHGVNGAEGFPLTEPEVDDIVATELWFALPAPARRARYAR